MRIAVVGAGPGGLCLGVKLAEAGFDDFVLLERGDGVGGTWRRNTYPGAACDVQSALYSFSFEIKVDWSRPYAPQPEILAYLEHVAEKYGLLPHCRFGTEVRRATWDEAAACWRVELGSGETIEAEVLVSALGMFNELARPAIEGLEDFAGTMFHSAEWDWEHDLPGEAVAVIGSAASAVQLVPEIVKSAGQVHLFQRTANWVLPKPDTPYTEEELAGFRADPTPILKMRVQLSRLMDQHMTFADVAVNAEREAAGLAAIDVVTDPAVRAKLRPTHPFGCKRPLLSNDFHAAFNRPNLELVTEAIERVTPGSVVTVDGVERPVDTIVLATGFEATRYLSALDVVGRDGLHIDEAWRDGASAYLGLTTPGFPNLFMLYGPFSPVNNVPVPMGLDQEIGYIMRLIAEARRRKAAVAPTVAATERFLKRIGAAFPETVWVGCSNWYADQQGTPILWPLPQDQHKAFFAEIATDDLDFIPAGEGDA